MSLIQLKSALEHHVGFQISTIAACRRLEQLLIKQGYYVSYTTLSRMFGLAKIKSNVRSSTLDELSKFIGHNDFEGFLILNQKKEEIQRLNLLNQLQIEAKLISGKEREAIEHLFELRDKNKHVYHLQTQTLARHLFARDKPAESGIKYLLDREEFASDIFQFFVYEDDINGFYLDALTQLKHKAFDNINLIEFYDFYSNRKIILKGENKIKVKPLEGKSHFHLISRSFELELITKKMQSKAILLRTEEILNRIKDSKDIEEHLAYAGRWCRGLIYSEQYSILKDNLEWKECCISLIENELVNKEFQSSIYSFLALTYGYHGSLAFMYNGAWENAKLESKLLLSLAFKQHDAFKIYKRLLGYV